MGCEMHGGGGRKGRGCVGYYTGRLTHLGRPLRLWRARPPCPRHCVGLPTLTRMPLQGKERERAAYFLRPGVHRFLELSMGVVVGRFVPLAFIAFFLGRTPTLEEEEEEEADGEEEEVFVCKDRMSALCLWIIWVFLIKHFGRPRSSNKSAKEGTVPAVRFPWCPLGVRLGLGS